MTILVGYCGSGAMDDVRVFLYPSFGAVDKGDGGIGRVVRSQVKHLPTLGVTLVTTPAEADVIACHIEIPEQFLKNYPEKKFVAHTHGLYWEGYDWPTWAIEANKLVMEAVRVADHVTSPSEWVSQTLRRATGRPVETVYHGVELDEWAVNSVTADLKKYVLFDKTRVDPICEIDSLTRIAELCPHIEFVTTAGNIDLPNVHCVGLQEFDKAKALTEGAWLYLATTRETFGVSVIQAMACGVPVAGYAWGGQAEICSDQNAILVAPGDADALALEIAALYDDAERYALMSAAALMRARDFDARRAAEKYAAMYKRMAADRPQKRVSVVVPAYNLAQYLPDTIRSVIDSLGVDDELIVVNDCSTDNTQDIIDSFTDERIVKLQTPQNLYLSGARNHGIARARGRYILPLDADDMLAPFTLDILATELDKDRHTHIAYGNVKFIEPDGKEWHSGWPLQFNQEWQSNQRNLLPYCSMYRRSVWEDLCGYRSHNRTAEDADFWTRASRYGYRPRMVTQADTLIYRNRPDSMSRSVLMHDWAAWFSPKLPAGASTDVQEPVPALFPPIISVVIPVGSGHELLVQTAIDSLEAQTFTEWECILVNDTGARMPVSFPSWVRVIDVRSNDGHVGVAAARNIGIIHASARLILPLDADDYLQPNALEAFYQCYTSMTPEVRRNTVLYCDFWEDPKTPGEYQRYFAQDYDPRKLITNGALHTVTALFHKDIWERAGGYPEDVVGWEDWGFQLACAEIGACSRRIASPLFTYRKHTGTRREDNMARFDESKRDIMKRFGDYWDGGKELMACGCQSGNQTTMYVAGESPFYADPNAHQDATLVIFNGTHGDGFNLTGKKTGVIYRVNKGEPFYALNADLELMLTMVGMNVAQIGPEISNALAGSEQPVLAAVGR